MLPDANDDLNPGQSVLNSLLPWVQTGLEIKRQLDPPKTDPVPNNPRALNREASWWSPLKIVVAVGGFLLLLVGGVLLLRRPAKG